LRIFAPNYKKQKNKKNPVPAVPAIAVASIEAGLVLDLDLELIAS